MFVRKFNKTKCVNGCELFNDNSNYLYWENRNVTNDEVEIADFLNNKYSSENAIKELLEY